MPSLDPKSNAPKVENRLPYAQLVLLTKSSTTNFGRAFLLPVSPAFASKWPKHAVFACQEGKKVGRK